MKRTYSPQAIRNIELEVMKTDWNPEINAQTVDEKVNTFHEIINTIINTFCSVKKVRIREDNPP